MAEDKESLHQGLPAQHADAAQLILGGRGSLYPDAEAQYWREAYGAEPYFQAGRNLEDYAPAYELGWTGFAAYGGEFDTADRVLANDWIVQKGVSTLTWEEARPACRAAWQRAHNASAYTTDGSAGPERVIETLKELADNARDGELGFLEAAAHTDTPRLNELFERRALACRSSAQELQDCLLRLGRDAEEEPVGTVGATAHRVWLNLRGLFGGASDETMLAECERGENAALARYRKALQQNLPPEFHALVQSQYESTQRNHDLIKTLLGQARAQAEAVSAGQTGGPAQGVS